MTKENLITAKLGVSKLEAKNLLHKNKIERIIIVDTRKAGGGISVRTQRKLFA